MSPITYAIATMDKPNAIAIPKLPSTVPAIAALPHPNKTRTIVPINSLTYLFINSPTFIFIVCYIFIFSLFSPIQHMPTLKLLWQKHNEILLSVLIH